MLISARKFKHITDHFIEPYFIQTDSSGKVMAICEKFSSLLSNYSITNNNYHSNLFDLFLDITDRIPEFSTDIENNGLPRVFDLHINSSIKKDLTIRWITSAVAFNDEQGKGWQLTGMEVSAPRNYSLSTTLEDAIQLQKEKT